ncbi:hypothetical protein LBMAG27_20910 [Bacteroidota bacterium]|nr:hypothetical protein LBMAG27_20910 [Bacteroidota bacterium]
MLTVFATTRSSAQVSAYGFASSAGTYTPIVGTVVAGSTGAADDNNFALIPIGFTFTYNGVAYTQVGCSANGYVRMGAVSTISYTSISSGPANNIALLNADLYGNAVGHDIEYQTTGAVGSRIFTVQYKNWGTFSGGLNEYNFQLQLFETTNVVQIVYGTFTPSITSTRRAGLRGTLATDFNIRTTTTNWAATTAGAVNTATCSISAAIKPALGQTFTWTPPTPCSGTPNTPVATGPAAACPAAAFTITATGYTSGVSNIVYQWQSDPGCLGTWGNVAGQTTPASGSFTQAAQCCYRLYTICNASGLSSISNTVTVNMNVSANCYCGGLQAPTVGAGAATSTADEDLGNVTIANNTTLNNTSICGAGGLGTSPNSVAFLYSNYTNLAAVQLEQTTTATFSLTSITCGGNFGNFMQMYIDYNIDGDFNDPGEQVYQPLANTVGPHIETGSFIVPLTATPGFTRLRVRCIESTPASYPALSACTNFTWGETEDYAAQIIATTSCLGVPSAGTTATTSATPVCYLNYFTLGTTTAPTNGTTVTYQWEENYNSLGWTNIGVNSGVIAATPNNIITTVFGLPYSSTCDFRLRVVCGFSSQTTNSAAVTVAGDIPGNCYCTPSYSTGNVNGGGDYLNQIVDFAGYTGPVTGANPPNVQPWYYYTPGSITTLDKGSAYNITLNNNPIYAENFRVWVDFDQDGIFNASECLSDQAYPGGTWLINGGATGTAAFTCPTNVTFPGMPATFVTRVRFRCSYFTTNMSSCATYTYGETEDYQVTINTLPDCAGVPTPGTTNTSDPTPCSGLPITLSVSGATTGLGGMTYRWEKAASCAGPWTNLGTSPSQTYIFPGAATTVFRRKMKCTLSNLPYGDSAYSTCLSLSAVLCYCAPSHTVGTSSGVFIDSVSVENGGIAHQSGANAVSPYYSDFTSTVAAGVMMAGAPYWVVVKTGTAAVTKTVTVWFDFNSDGDFVDAGEAQTSIVTNSAGAFTYHFVNVPVAATIGTTRMRVRISNVSTVLDPCLGTAPNYVQGESEDYAMNIIANACIGATQAGFLAGITPQLTVANDFIDINMDNTAATGTLTGYEIDWTAPYDFLPPNNTLANYLGTFIANVNPAVPTGYVYVRGKYQNGGCPVAYSNSDFVKLNCAQSCINNTNDNDDIARVRLGTAGFVTTILDNNQGVWPATHDATLDGYQNYLANGPYHVSRQVPYAFQVGVSTLYTEGVRVWIDMDGDGILTAAESVYSDAGSTGLHPAGIITIPCGTSYVGPAVMRVMNTFAGTPNVDPCFGAITGARTWGEIEEYTLYIDENPFLDVNPAAAVCTGQTAVLNGTGPGVVTGWQWNPTNGVNGVVMNPTNGTAATVTVSTSTPSNVFFTVTGTLASGCTSYNVVPVATTPLAGTVTPTSSIICSGGVKLLTVTGAAGAYQWQISSDNITWADISGATSGLSYTTTGANGTTKKYYRLLSKSAICYDISSNTAIVDIASTPLVTIPAATLTATSAVVNWTPAGGGSYSISWTGAGSGSTANATPPVTLIGLTPNTNLSVTVTLTNPAACAGVSVGTATAKTLCAAPPAPTFGTITATSAIVNIPAGATSYVVYYKLLQISNSYGPPSACLAGGSTYTITSTTYPGAAVSVYLQACNCPSVGQYGQAGPAVVQYLLPGTSTCPTPTPFTTNEVTSTCPNRITVALGGNTSNTYRVTFRRVLPTVSAPITYNVTGTSMNFTVLNTPLPQVWEVYAVSTCGPSYGIPYSIMTQVVQVQVKGGCNKIQNLVLSHATCHSLTATWNVGDCGIPSTNLVGYTVWVKPGTSQWSGYPSTTNVKSANIFASGTVIQVYVRANSCNGSFGPASDIQSVTTLSVGCREEDQQTEESLNNTGITTENGTLSLFPNPNAGEFNIDLQMGDVSTQDVRIEVMNMLGQIVQTQITSISGGHLTENVGMPSSITSGNYMVRVMVGEKTTFTSRVNISK